jgi:probable phosphoglycerate mutase
MSRLLLIRHAPTAETGVRLTGRLPGVSLSEQGRTAAAALGERLASTRIHAVYTSPIERTRETADAIARHQRLEPIGHDGLLEVDYGDWSGRTLRSLYRLKAWRTVQFAPSRMRFPNGESLTEAQARGVAACEEAAARHPRRTVALVTHGDIIRSAVAHFLGEPLDLFQRVTVAPASVTVIDLDDGRPPRVVAVNGNGESTTWQ